MSKGRGNRPRRSSDHNGSSVYGAHPARLTELIGCESPVALLQALDLQQPLGERSKLGVFIEQLGDGFGSHGRRRRSPSWGQDR